MKKIVLAVAILACTMSAKAEIVKRDTVAYNGKYEFTKQVKENEKTGEVSVTYKALLLEFGGKKVAINKATYEGGKINAIIYTTDADGNKRIAKAINK